MIGVRLDSSPKPLKCKLGEFFDATRLAKLAIDAKHGVLAAAGSYASLFVLLLRLALRGQSIVTPDALALTWLAIWAVTTVSVFGWIGLSSPGASRDGLDRMAVWQPLCSPSRFAWKQ